MDPKTLSSSTSVTASPVMISVIMIAIVATLVTGGKGAFTQQAHGEFIVSSETKCPPNTQQAHGEYF